MQRNQLLQECADAKGDHQQIDEDHEGLCGYALSSPGSERRGDYAAERQAQDDRPVSKTHGQDKGNRRREGRQVRNYLAGREFAKTPLR